MSTHKDKLGPIPDDNWENDWTPTDTMPSPEQKQKDDEMVRRLKQEQAKRPKQ